MITQSRGDRTFGIYWRLEGGWRSMSDLRGDLRDSWVTIKVVDGFETMTVERGDAFQGA